MGLDPITLSAAKRYTDSQITNGDTGENAGGLTEQQATDLAENTKARHTHENKSVLDEFSLTPQGYLEHKNKALAFLENIPTDLTAEEISNLMNGTISSVWKKHLGSAELRHYADLIKEEVIDQIPEGSVLDKTLTIEGAGADAKATGDRLLGVEYQTVITEEAYEHKDLPEEKTVTIHGEGTWGDTAYINYGIDLVPRGGFSRSFPWQGLSITQKGDTYKLSGSVTTSSGVYFTKDGSNNFYTELPDGLIGKTVTMLAFTNLLVNDKSTISLTFYDANKTQLLNKSHHLAKTSTTVKVSCVIPEGVVYYSVGLYFKEVELNHETKIYVLVEDEFDEVYLADNSATTIVTNNSFSTLPYKSSVQYKVSLKDYISNFTNGGTVTYLTPEDFGAKGNGETDDSEAITFCLEQASISKQTILMAGKYYITMPIEIKVNGLNIIANDIVYDGTDTAIKISGQNNSIKIHSLTSGGIGIVYRGDNNKIVRHNDININSIHSNSHGIVFYNGLMGIFQNTIKFNLIRAGGSGTYGICWLDAEGSSWVTENHFYGGQISNCEWAVYKCGGNSKFYGVQVEENVQGGFYIDSGVAILYPRIVEAMRDGNLPIFKIIDPNGVVIHTDTAQRVFINQIDLSEAKDTIETSAGGISILEGQLGIIHGKILPVLVNDGENTGHTTTYSDKTYMWGKYLIFTPHIPYRKVITTEELDTRLIGSETSYEDARKLTQLPTNFVVNSVDTEIYLHPSYCVFGYNEFQVEQSNGFTCKVYDVKGTLIFDGTEQGNGTYKFNVYKDYDLCDAQSYGQLRADFLGHYWQVTKETTVNDVLNALPTWSGGAY